MSSPYSPSLAYFKKVASNTYATWNPSDKGAHITLSNGNLTYTTDGTRNSVRSTIGKSTGKWYWEHTETSGGTAAGPAPGIMLATASLNSYPGAGTGGYEYFGGVTFNGIYQNGSLIAAAPTFTNSDVIGLAFDADAGTLKYFKNNVLQATISSIAAGTWYAAGGDGFNGVAVAVASFGASALTYTPPSGYNSGLYS